MIKIPEIATQLKKYKHSKEQSGDIIISQFREFYLQRDPFNAPFSLNIDTPLSWWKTCILSPPYLQLLGIKLFSITPHTASCERIWSICGWMTGKRRTNLSIENLESLVKIHSYYIINKESELNLYSKEYTENEIYQELYNAQIEEEEEEEDKDEIENINLDDYDLDDDEETVWENLNLLEIIDLENNNFDDTDNNQITENLDNEDELNTFIQDLENEEDYDPNQIAQKHFDDIDEIFYF
jgi:hypothetical protein